MEQPNSPFFHYNSMIDCLAIICRHAVPNLLPSKEYLTNFLGAKIDTKVYPPLLAGREGQIEPIPIPANWHADISEWAAAFRAVELSGSRFSMIELGCGWGCWMINTGCAARRMGKESRLTGIEGDQEHIAMAKSALAANGFNPEQYRVVHGIAASESGFALFPVADDASVQWGSEPIIGASAEFMSRAVASGKFIQLPLVGLRDAAGGVERVDLLHIDIQGGEYAFLNSSISSLNEIVAYVLVGTHSRQIEGRIFDLMLSNGWRLEIERPALCQLNEHGPHVTVDGVQAWRNMRLLP